MGDPQQNETQSLPEWMTVAELASVLRLNRKTVYGWIATGEIGDQDGVFVVRGRYLMHWPTFRAQQFKPRERLRGQLPKSLEEISNGMVGDRSSRPPTDRI